MKEVSKQYCEAATWVRQTVSGLFSHFYKTPIDTSEGMFEFVRTRSAFVTQKKLYGYLKERMGTRYPKMFDDEQFVQSINIAKMHVFAASLSDLTIHAVAHAAAGSQLGELQRWQMAVCCYREGLAENMAQAPDTAAPDAWLSAFEKRLEGTYWENIAAGGSAFTESPKALIRWAPIADELKKHDCEIVENSIRFAWNEIRQDFRRRLDPGAVVKDWKSGQKSNTLIGQK